MRLIGTRLRLKLWLLLLLLRLLLLLLRLLLLRWNLRNSLLHLCLLLELLLVCGLLGISGHGLHPFHALLLHELLLHHRVDRRDFGTNKLRQWWELDGCIEGSVRLRHDRHVGLELEKIVFAQ